MTQDPIFARIRPKTIRITERYNLSAEVASNSRTEAQELRSGTIEIVVPYDGHKHLNAQALDDIEHQIPDAWERESLSARIGYLLFENVDGTDLAETYSIERFNEFPVTVPVLGDYLAGPEDLTSGQRVLFRSYDYRPRSPEPALTNVKVRIRDEEVMTEHKVDSPCREISVSKEMAGANFNQKLMLEFQLNVNIPIDIAKRMGERVPALTYLALNWPAPLSHRHFRLSVPKQTGRHVRYSPEYNGSGAMEWKNIDFQPSHRQEGTDWYVYASPPMRLILEYPGELYGSTRLSGVARIRIPTLLSRLRLNYFGVDGRAMNVPVESNTFLKTKLKIHLNNRFTRKTYSPYRHLHFQGVQVDELRLADISMLLRDLRFEHDSPSELTDNASELSPQVGKRFCIDARRNDGREIVRLRLVIDDIKSQTTRHREIPGGQTYQTQLERGHMIIHIRGQLTGNSDRLTSIMNDLQRMLKERFSHVNLLD